VHSLALAPEEAQDLHRLSASAAEPVGHPGVEVGDLITGASVMGTVFALGSATTKIMTASPQAVAAGMRITFAVSAALIVVALTIAVGSRALSRRTSAE